MLAEVFEKPRNQHRRDGGDEGQAERTGEVFFLRTGHFGNLPGVVQDHLGAVDNLSAYFRGDDGMRLAVKQRYVQLFFQLLDHQAQGGLGEAAGIGRFAKMPVIIHGYDVFQLLQRHIFQLILSMQR